MIETYLQTLATVLGSMEEAKKNRYAFSTTTYTGFQCIVDKATSEKFKGLPGVVWVLPDSYIDMKNKDYGGTLYICRISFIPKHEATIFPDSLTDTFTKFKSHFLTSDKYVNGEIIPSTYPTYQPKQRYSSKIVGKRYENGGCGPVKRKWPRQESVSTSE